MRGNSIMRGVSPRAANRRQVVVGATALALLRILPAAARQESTPSPAEVSGEWSFADDAGQTITRSGRPQRVVGIHSLAAALWDYGVRPVGVYGTLYRPDGTPEVYAGNIDLDSVVLLGEEYGAIDLEALVTLEPDLIVNDMWSDPPDVWGLDADTIARIEQIAPIAQISFVERPITDTISSVERLAAALGADLEAESVVAAREEFERAREDLRAAIAEKPGLTAMFASGLPEESFWVANPSMTADLIFFKELSLDMVQPESAENFEELSWEQVGKYDADLILMDSRQWSATGPELTAQVPTFASLPASRAGQFGTWQMEYVPNYVGFTPVLVSLTEDIRATQPLAEG